MIRPVLACLALAVATLALAACGEKEDRTTPSGTQRLDLVLDYLPNADHAGIYLAREQGLFRRAGLDVRPVVPPDPAAPLQLLAAGRADVAISYEPEVLLARDRGLEVVAVAALVSEPLTSIMGVGRDAPRAVRDLAGGTVGTAGIPYQEAYLRTILRTAGVDPERVRRVDVGFNLIPAMLSRRVDATLGAFWNVEGVQLRREGRRPRIIRVDDAGVPTYDELVLVARAEDLRRRGPAFRALLQALSDAHVALRRDPERGIEPLLAADRDLQRDDTLASVRATLPAFFPSQRGRPWGWMESGEWARYARWMEDNDLLRRPAQARALTTEFLPGEGL